MTVELRMVLDERKDGSTIGGEIRNHIGLADDELSVQDVIISVVAVVDDEGKIHHHSCSVALAVGAGVGFVGWHAVVDKKLVVVVAVHDETSACAFDGGGDILPFAHKP